MTYAIDETHDPQLQSWVESANDPQTDFPIQNLPFGIFADPDDEDDFRIGVAIGDRVLDLTSVAEDLWMERDPGDPTAEACVADSLDYVLGLDSNSRMTLRRRISGLLSRSAPEDERALAEKRMLPRNGLELAMPVTVSNYTDFYASVYHATNIGRMFRPDNPLMPNYKWIPIGYHGRSSSVIVSGTDIRRPLGQTMADGAGSPDFGPSKVLDYEIEMGFIIGTGNRQGEPIPITRAEDHIFGLCVVNDWSARDIQRWEYQPLGPFLSKSFATSISPWLVTMEALAPFRLPAFIREADDPQPLPYLDSPENRSGGGFDIHLEVLVSTAQMRSKGIVPHRLSRGNTKDLYWTFAQMLTHHSSNGCNLESGDLIASGTVSGATPESLGSLIEITQRGSNPIELPSGEVRRFLENGDEVIMRGWCEREGFRRIGFGECRGVVVS